MPSRTPLLIPLALLLGCGAGATAPGGATPAAGRSASAVAPAAIAVRSPAEFVRRQPGSATFAGADGARLVHASGFSFDTGLARADDAAAAFLASHGAAFGVTDRHELSLRGAPAHGEVAAVRVRRSIDGLPVFGGDLVVGVRGGKVFLVNTADVAPTVVGSHDLGADEAGARALAAARGRATSLIAVEPGWRSMLGAVRAVYRVDFNTVAPSGDWRFYVDGVTGDVLFREDRRFRASTTGKAYQVSPVETSASLCPISGGFHTACATPVTVAIDHLDATSALVGTQTGVWNCQGGDAPTAAADVTTACAPVNSVSGTFEFTADGTGTSLSDDFAAVMAYYHLDKHVSFFKAIDPTLPGGASLALNGSLPALVNVQEGGQPYDNAYFSGNLNAMVFGQGTSIDLAYDATVMYHEFTHGVVDAWGGFYPDIDALGGVDEPGAVNEGTADAMTASETGRSAIGAFAGPSMANAAVLRDMADPNATRTCKGNGSTVSKWGTTDLNGLDGEVHDDGEIWSGFFWEVFDGLRTAGLKGCNGACEAGAAIQYKAIQLAGGTLPKFATYWVTMKAAADALYPTQPAVGSYIQCVAQRRKLDQCDRTVPVYAGESKLQFVRLRYSPFQLAVTADSSATGSISLCSAQGTPTTIYARRGQPVQIATNPGSTPNPYDPTAVTADFTFTMTQPCQSGTYSLNFDAADAGTWYLLFDSPDAFVASSTGPGFDIYKAAASATGIAARPAASAPPTCTPPAVTNPLTILPASPSVAPGGTQAFTASGGSGTGYTWSIPTNGSGGTITAAGVYTAGTTGGVVDVVRVTDSASGTASVNVTVTGSSGGGGSKGGCASGEGAAGALSLLAAAAALVRFRRGRRAASGSRA